MMNDYRGRGGETECQALGAPIEEIMKAVEAAGTACDGHVRRSIGFGPHILH